LTARRSKRWSLCLALPAVLLAAPTRASTAVERLSERGPATFAVGTMFTLAAPPALLIGAATGGRVGIHACRFGHGLKMLAAGTVLLPVGLLAAPFNRDGVPHGWLDGVVESVQEDYCTRPLGAFYP
jgi:hypothetical protein